MKKEIKLSCAVKNMFIGKSDKDDERKIIKKKWTPNKGIYIDTLKQDMFEVKRIIRLILKSPAWKKRHGALIKFFPK